MWKKRCSFCWRAGWCIVSKNEPRRPLNGTFELTGRCDLHCKMCLMRVDAPRMEALGLRERTAEEWIDMARQAARLRALNVHSVIAAARTVSEAEAARYSALQTGMPLKAFARTVSHGFLRALRSGYRNNCIGKM